MSQKFTITAEEIARLTAGKLIGTNTTVERLGTLEHGGANAVGFFSENPQYRSQLANTQLGIILVEKELNDCKCSQILVDNVRIAWRLLSETFAQALEQPKTGISPQAIVSPKAKIADKVYIGAGAVIEDDAEIGEGAKIEALAYIAAGVIIGAETRIGAGAKILPRSRIGRACNILANAVIGERGFGNSFENGKWIALPQLGGVQIGDEVEIGAGTMIDRGAIGDTIIKNGVKLDNLIQVAHNVQIGEHTAIAGCTVIAGSTTIGAYCIIGGATVINGHISICDKTIITGHTSISKSINQAGTYSSAMPAVPDREWKKFLASLKIMSKKFINKS